VCVCVRLFLWAVFLLRLCMRQKCAQSYDSSQLVFVVCSVLLGLGPGGAGHMRGTPLALYERWEKSVGYVLQGGAV